MHYLHVLKVCGTLPCDFHLLQLMLTEPRSWQTSFCTHVSSRLTPAITSLLVSSKLSQWTIHKLRTRAALLSQPKESITVEAMFSSRGACDRRSSLQDIAAYMSQGWAKKDSRTKRRRSDLFAVLVTYQSRMCSATLKTIEPTI